MNSHFWDVPSLSDMVKWILLIIVFVVSQYTTTKLLIQRMNGFEKWVKAHEVEANSRDALLVALQIATAKLTTLSELAEKRLSRIEDRGHS